MPQDAVPNSDESEGAAEAPREPQARRAADRGGRPQALTGRMALVLAFGALVALGLCQVSGLSERLRPLPLPIDTATPMATRTPLPTWTPTDTPSPTPVPSATATSVPVMMAGGLAAVSGTGSEELRVREGPGLEYETLGTLSDGTPLTVLDGPQTADGYQWWKVATDDGQEGWVAGDWLLPVSP
jgi:hypothetical protein